MNIKYKVRILNRPPLGFFLFPIVSRANLLQLKVFYSVKITKNKISLENVNLYALLVNFIKYLGYKVMVF